MGKTCCVPMCNSGYRSCNEKVSLFRVPEEKLDVWQRKIPRNDRQLTKRDFVCEKHFSQQFVIREVKNDLWTYPLRYPKLSEDAIPTIFPECPKYLSKEVRKRKIIVKTSPVAEKRQKLDESESVSQNPDECKARWKNLRGSLTRNLSQRLKPAGKIPKTFYLTKYMQFVLPFAKSKYGYTYEALSSESAKEENIFDPNFDDNSNNREEGSKDSWSSMEVKNGIEFFDENIDDSSESAVPQKTHALTKNNPVPTTSSIITAKDPLETRIDHPIVTDYNDADKHFLLSLLPHLHCLTATEKLQFQIKTLNIINEIMSAREKI